MSSGSNGKTRFEAPAKPSWGLACPSCGDTEVAINLDLNDMAIVTCSGCDDSYSVATAVKKSAAQLASWRTLARWLEAGVALAIAPETDAE
jgi:hypothetical protein